MRLEEQFKNAYIADSFAKQYENYVEIAENFAIGFAEWLSDNNTNKGTIEQLLEIYKETL